MYTEEQDSCCLTIDSQRIHTGTPCRVPFVGDKCILQKWNLSDQTFPHESDTNHAIVFLSTIKELLQTNGGSAETCHIQLRLLNFVLH